MDIIDACLDLKNRLTRKNIIEVEKLVYTDVHTLTSEEFFDMEAINRVSDSDIPADYVTQLTKVEVVHIALSYKKLAKDIQKDLIELKKAREEEEKNEEAKITSRDKVMLVLTLSWGVILLAGAVASIISAL